MSNNNYGKHGNFGSGIIDRRRLEKLVMSGRYSLLTNPKTSHFDQHSHDVSDIELLNQVVSADPNVHKDVATKFLNPDWMNEYVGKTILRNIDDIVEWVNDKNSKRPSYVPAIKKYDVRITKHRFNAVLHNDDPNIFVGNGFMVDEKGIVREYMTNNVGVVINNEPHLDPPLSIHTAYPDLTHDVNATLSHRDLTPILEQTDTYKQADPVTKSVLYFKTANIDRSDVRMMQLRDLADGSKRLILKLKTTNPNFDRIINISKGSFLMGTFDRDEKALIGVTKIDPNSQVLWTMYPNAAPWITKMQKTIDGPDDTPAKTTERTAPFEMASEGNEIVSEFEP